MKQLFMLGCFLVVARSLAAQTKEETISWIQEKVNKYGNKVMEVNWIGLFRTYVSTSINYNTVNQEEFKENSSEELYTWNTSSISLDEIINAEKSHEERLDEFRFIGVSTKGLKVRRKYTDKPFENVSYFSFHLEWSAEPDLFQRFYKALLTLVAYNKERQPKEAF